MRRRRPRDGVELSRHQWQQVAMSSDSRLTQATGNSTNRRTRGCLPLGNVSGHQVMSWSWTRLPRLLHHRGEGKAAARPPREWHDSRMTQGTHVYVTVYVDPQKCKIDINRSHQWGVPSAINFMRTCGHALRPLVSVRCQCAADVGPKGQQTGSDIVVM